MTHDPTASDVKPRSSAGFWLQAVLGLALAGAGIYMIVDRGGSHYGFLLMCIGAIITPWRVFGIIGGAGLIVLGGLLLWHGLGAIDYVIGAVAVLMGVTTIRDRVKALKPAASARETPRS